MDLQMDLQMESIDVNTENPSFSHSKALLGLELSKLTENELSWVIGFVVQSFCLTTKSSAALENLKDVLCFPPSMDDTLCELHRAIPHKYLAELHGLVLFEVTPLNSSIRGFHKLNPADTEISQIALALHQVVAVLANDADKSCLGCKLARIFADVDMLMGLMVSALLRGNHHSGMTQVVEIAMGWVGGCKNGVWEYAKGTYGDGVWGRESKRDSLDKKVFHGVWRLREMVQQQHRWAQTS